MPLTRCRNFNDDGSRKTWNGTEVQCRPNCQFTHPSDRDWDHARPPPIRGRGGPPRGDRGRAADVRSFSRGQERGSSSAWDDYMTASGSKPSAASSGRRAPSDWGGQTMSGTSGWSDTGAGGSSWGSGTNNNVITSDGWSNELAASGEQASSSQWDTQPVGWGSAANVWGSAGTDLGPGWGEKLTSDQGSQAPPAAAVSANVAGPAGLNALGGTGTKANPDTVTTMTLSSRAMPSASTSSEPNIMHNEQPGEDTSTPAMVDLSSSERKASPSAATFLQSEAIRTRPLRGDHDNHTILKLLGTDKKSCLALDIAMTLKMRELNNELSQLSELLKSRRVVATRATIDLLQSKITDARVMVEAERNAHSQGLMHFDSPCLSVVQHALVTFGRDNEQMEQLKDWLSRAEKCLNHLQAEDSPFSPVERSNAVTFVSKLNQLKGRAESLAETNQQCQDLQFYNTFLNDQIQDKKNLIITAIINGQDVNYNHLFSTSLSTLQKQGELWNQTLQNQAGEFAQALLQYDQLREDEKIRSISKAEGKSIIQQLQANIIQRRSQLQALQEGITQLQLKLVSLKQQQQSHISIDPSTSHIQKYIQGYIQAKAISNIQTAFSNIIMQFATIELKAVEKVWRILQPYIQMSIWLQDTDIHKTDEEMEIREVEEFLTA